MRKIWLSENTDRTWLLSSRASASEVPNGFSITARTSTCSDRASPAAPSASTITAKNSGAVER